MDKIELLGGACFSHGPYTFYKAVRIGNGRVLRLGNFFLTKLWTDADLISIGELQLLWIDNRGSNQPLASLRLYFLPENTPDGRRDTHGEDEVLTISEKVVVRVHDLVTWLSPTLEWSWGRAVEYPPSNASLHQLIDENHKYDENITANTITSTPITLPQVLTDPGIDFSDVEKHQKEYEINLSGCKTQDGQTRVVVLSYPRYCRYRALLRRLEGAEPSWLCSSVAAALGGFTALPGTRVLFCRDTFDYPDLETHELLCNHLAPKLKGRPRRKRKKRSVSPGESSNESEASVASTSRGSVVAITNSIMVLKPPSIGINDGGGSHGNAIGSSGVRRSERNASGDEKKFIIDVQNFMNSRGTPVGKMPLLGYKQIDLYLFYVNVQKLGGYDAVSAGRLWKSIYDEIGGNTGSTSAATITRRHYERLLLPYERHQKGEETKVRPSARRSKSISEETPEIKTESPISDTPSPLPPTETITITNATDDSPPSETSPSSPPTSTPSTQLTTISPLSSEKPKTEVKTSSLRSVRVKPDRLKSLNTIIANTNINPTSNYSQNSLPSPPPSSNGTITSMSTPATTPSTTPTAIQNNSVLERQLNSPLMSQHIPPSSSPICLPVVQTTTNTTAIVTLTPPPDKDIKELKLDTKQTTLLAQGKENIPLIGEKLLIPPPKSPKSPEVIDLEMESEVRNDKITIPSFKKRKLEILREGGLEVTAVEIDSRPSVIQATITPITTPLLTVKIDDKPIYSSSSSSTSSSSSSSSLINNRHSPKLISVTVTPDIDHMLPSPQDIHQSRTQKNNNSPINNNNNCNNSRVINLGTSVNSNLIQIYNNTTSSLTNTTTVKSPSSPIGTSHVFASPALPSERLQPSKTPPLPPRVTQSRSIFGHGERTVYGDPKDVLSQNVVIHNTFPVLDLTSKQQINDKPFSRPNLEIVRVPTVPRPNLLNLEMKNSLIRDIKVSESSRKSPFNYPAMLDTRTMASNNLEITLVSPKQQQRQKSCTPPAPTYIPPQSPPTKSQNNGINHNNNLQIQQQQRMRQVNGKFSNRPIEQITPYSSRKMVNHQVIPNVPNLNHISNNCYSSARNISQHQQHQRPSSVDKRKSDVLSRNHINHNHHSHHNHHRRISEGDKSLMPSPQHHQQQQMMLQKIQNSRSNDNRRHSVPNLPTGYIPSIPHAASVAAQAAAVGGGGANPNNLYGHHNSHSSHHHHPQMSNNSSGKFLPPMLDPVYYSAIYNGLFPPPMPTSTATPQFMQPEFSNYYKELLASSTQSRLSMGQHQPTVPTSK